MKFTIDNRAALDDRKAVRDAVTLFAPNAPDILQRLDVTLPPMRSMPFRVQFFGRAGSARSAPLAAVIGDARPRRHLTDAIDLVESVLEPKEATTRGEARIRDRRERIFLGYEITHATVSVVYDPVVIAFVERTR